MIQSALVSAGISVDAGAAPSHRDAPRIELPSLPILASTASSADRGCTGCGSPALTVEPVQLQPPSGHGHPLAVGPSVTATRPAGDALATASHESCDSEPVTNHVALMVTRRCNMECGHCSVMSSPKVRSQPDPQQLLHYVRQAADAGVRSLLITGGEPMIREDVVLLLLQECQQRGIAAMMTTNGFWGRTLSGARSRLLSLRQAGLRGLTVSYDQYHAEFQGSQPAVNIARAAEELDFTINISITRTVHDSGLDEFVRPFTGLTNVLFRFYDVQPVGAARSLDRQTLRSEIEGSCNACHSPAITDDGRVTACNGPAYFVPAGHPLHIGSLDQTSFGELAQRHRDDPILDTIRTHGPARLLQELRTVPGFETFGADQQFHGMCELCHAVTSNADAVAALRRTLSDPAHQCRREALRQIRKGSMQVGELGRGYVNSVSAGRVFLRAARPSSARFSADTAKVLGRADLDWERAARYLTECGLARPLLGALDHTEITRWAPPFFVERLRDRAVADSCQSLVGREALRHVARALWEMDARGVVLRAAALSLAAGDHAGQVAWSSGSPVELYVNPAMAPELHRRLLQGAFTGSRNTTRSGAAVLSPIWFEGLPLLIQTRIMPRFWGLPEGDLLASTRPVSIAGFEPLFTLDPEGMLLHEGVHATARIFSRGLQTAHNVQWILDQSPQLDWQRLAQRVAACGVPRAFWTPIRVLAQQLDWPQQVLASAPHDTRQRRLELIAARRLFQPGHEAAQNAFIRAAMYLMLSPSWRGQLSSLSALLSDQVPASEAVAVPRRPLTLWSQLRQSRAQWRKYRRAVTRVAGEPAPR